MGLNMEYNNTIKHFRALIESEGIDRIRDLYHDRLFMVCDREYTDDIKTAIESKGYKV